MLSSDSLESLQRFCEHEDFSDVMHDANYIRGLLFAVCASPEIPMPEQWFVWIINNSGQLKDSDVNKLSDLLINLLREQLQCMREEKVHLPSDLTYENSQEALQRYMSGLVAGHGLLESHWDNAWQSMLNEKPEDSKLLYEDLMRCLKMFTTFANTKMAIEQATARGQDNFAQSLPALSQSLSTILQDYVRISGQLVSYLPNQFEVYQDKLPTLN